MTECQSGFRKGYSTTSCLLNLQDLIYQKVDQGFVCRVLFLDLRKAFNTVNHMILIEKLRILGLRNSSLKWARSYLEGSMQVMKVNGTLSDPVLMTCSVRQGSILGPLFFTLYINDLPLILNNAKCNLYADDS